MIEIKKIVTSSTKSEEIDDYKENTMNEIMKDIYYICEESYQLKQQIEVGKEARKKLDRNDEKITSLMETYLKIKKEEM